MQNRWILFSLFVFCVAVWACCTNKDGCNSQCEELRHAKVELSQKIKQCEERVKNTDQQQAKISENLNGVRDRARSRISRAADARLAKLFEERIFEVTQDSLQAATIESNILFSIQNHPTVWAKFGNYDPLDEQGLVRDPVRALIVLMEIGKGTASLTGGQTTLLSVLQSNLGGEEGIVVSRMKLE